MLELTQEQIARNNALLDMVKADLALNNEVKLALALGLVPSGLSKIRHGTAAVSVLVLARMHEDYGYEFSLLRQYVPVRAVVSKETNA